MHRPLSFSGTRAALVLVDLQEEHRKDERFLVSGYDAVLAGAARLIKAARGADWPILHAAYVRDFSVSAARPFEPVQPGGAPYFSAPGDWTEICSEVAPLSGERVIHKNDASCFASAEFEGALKAMDVEWIVLAGVWTEACVAATLRDAQTRGYRVLLAKDACGSGTEAMHRSALIHLANRIYGGGVADCETLSALIGGQTRDVWQLVGSTPLRFDLDTMDEVYASL